MATEIQTIPSFPRRMTAAVRWRNFCRQWRHCYALLIAVFGVVWRVSALPIPRLEDSRIMGGLHSLPVLLLMDVLKLMWIPPLVAAALYFASFAIRPLNTAVAVAVSALCCTTLLALILVSALICLVL
jgi:hypothetical protein